MGRGSTAAAHAPPLFLGLASRAQIVHEVFLGQRRGDGAGLRDRGDDARRPATVPGRHAGVSEGRIVSPGRTDARGVRQARGRRVRGAAHVRRVASSNCAVDGRAMNVRWVVRNARRHLRIHTSDSRAFPKARAKITRAIDRSRQFAPHALCPNRSYDHSVSNVSAVIFLYAAQSETREVAHTRRRTTFRNSRSFRCRRITPAIDRDGAFPLSRVARRTDPPLPRLAVL